ncbi:MAG: LD-carboxypeptidase [Candidatus Marinimicrobia bacterium]|nr:LD-carboxypeptidase [Candidatus Neomarinimicrobiota bacterium]
MTLTRRQILQMVATGVAATQVPLVSASGIFSKSPLKPPRLNAGDTIGLINPAGATFYTEDVLIAKETMAALGLKTKSGKHLMDRYGGLAGKDADRAADVNEMFRDPEVDAIIALRGGWGCNRILDLLDYHSIAKNPKIIMGYSDITSLLLAFNAKTSLVTFHGPVGISTWNKYSTDYVKRLLFDGEIFTLENPKEIGDNLTQTKDRIETIHGGTATGRLLGGNLSVLAAMIGSDYLPDFKDNILFLEDVGEDAYRIDRMLTQLKLSGVLESISGFVFGKCSKCDSSGEIGDLTLEEIFNDHIKPLGIPAWYGSMIGHIEDKFTVPLGVEAKIDAQKGSITLLESAVV